MEKITEKQYNYLIKLGAEPKDIQKLSKQNASYLIAQLRKAKSDIQNGVKENIVITMPSKETTKKKVKTQKVVEEKTTSTNPQKVVNSCPPELSAYLIECAKKDKPFGEVFDETKLNECWKYVIEWAKKELNGKDGALLDNKVFEQARHYYTDVLQNKVESEEIVNDIVDDEDDYLFDFEV